MDVRARILEAALRLLAERGAHELTQPRVAKAAGVRQSHLTYYFPTRGELLQELARYSIEKLRPDVIYDGLAWARDEPGILAFVQGSYVAAGGFWFRRDSPHVHWARLPGR